MLSKLKRIKYNQSLFNKTIRKTYLSYNETALKEMEVRIYC